MCCKNSTKKIIPFLITFFIGIFLASFFYSSTNSTLINNNRLEKETNYTRTSCGFEKMKRHYDIMDEVPAVPVAPPPPPAPPVAPPPASEAFEDTLFSPTPPETIILREKLKKKNK